jgi:hypothetical protein
VKSERRPFTITKVEKHPAGYYTARVSADGLTVAVDNRYGSWQADVRAGPRLRSFRRVEVLPHVAAVLQKKVPTTKTERKGHA